ncbi:unnamed protein product [Medioppia subpectinata]|uniref:Caspase family p20 domain-containing protein n=1 Tax=Medioppia subpectinata TaxID=1979941 RepID=A0A7R9PYA2_9ACAR|nr:unnamed protein product [Medioppia subpectinata]CAG2105679.1 unnamed protein product [Medioppia subpectinata]
MDQIKTKLTSVATTDSYHGDAFIMMFIGDGYNEQIIGWRPDTENEWPPPAGDCMAFSEIVATFGWTRAPALRQKTKVFIINCDRLKVSIDKYDTIVDKRGHPMWHSSDKEHGQIGCASQFGQTLSHTIAQYSAYKSLIEMFVMTLNRMEEDLMDSE